MELYQHDLLFLRLRLSDCVRVYEQQHMARVRGHLSGPCRDHWQGIQKQIIQKNSLSWIGKDLAQAVSYLCSLTSTLTL